jgi:two-component system, cell cycle sensor histidine kinase and response regulator CckA
MSEPSTPNMNDTVQAHLQHLQREFAGKLPGRLDDIRTLHGRLQRGAWNQTEAETLHRLAHGISGTAGTFGMHGISDAARALEARLLAVLRRGSSPGPAEWEAIEDGIAHLQELVSSRAASGSNSALMPLIQPTPAKGALVHLVMEDMLQGNALRSTLEEQGFDVRLHGDVTSFRQCCEPHDGRTGEVVVMDMAFGEGDPDGAGLLRELELGRHGRRPVVVTVQESSLAERLGAARAGASRTLVRPIDPVRLVDTLNTLTGRQPQRPYRVLLVDDDAILLEAQAGILRAAGMDVRAVSRPLETLQALENFPPDVLVLDVYMPDASGPELAAALRESDDYLQLPILFLSAETDLTQQLLALNLGGDDFLVKPVQPEHLVAAVTARARRARQAQALRQRLQTTLYEREREHLALDHHAIVSIADRDGNITYANDMFCEVSGYQRRELLGSSHRALVSDPLESGIVRSIWRAIKSGKVWHGEMCCLRKDGSHYWVESTVTPFVDSAGEVYQYVTIQTDISHIKSAEATLTAQRDMQRVISVAAARLMAAPSGKTPEAIDDALRESGMQLGADRAQLFRFSRDGAAMTNTQEWNAEGMGPRVNKIERLPVEITPWMKEQFLKHGRVVIQDLEDLPRDATADRQALRERGIRSLAVFSMFVDKQPLGFIGYSLLHKTGLPQQRKWTHEEVELLRVLADVVASALARNRAETKLRKSEARLNFLVSSSPVAIYTRDVHKPFGLNYVSSNVEQLLGLAPLAVTADALRGLGLIHTDDRQRVADDLPVVLERGTDVGEYRVRCGDGSYLWVQDQRSLVRDAAGEPMEIVGCWLDITERKRIEEELQNFNQELGRRVAEQTRSVIESERFARATLDALSARVVILDSNGTVLAANRAWEFFGAQETVREGSRYIDTCDSACNPDGPVGRPLADGIRSVMLGESNEFLHEYICRRGSEPNWFLCRVERFPGDGQLRVVVSHENITQMKLAERQQLRSQRLESLGTLAGGVAHDLNNALAPVLMGMTILRDEYPQETKLFDMIEASAQRGTHMVRQLLTFAKGAEGERIPVCPSQVVDELERLIQGSFPKNIELQLQRDDNLPAVVGDPTQLHQVLLNLCVNARDAMPDGGILSVRLQSVMLDAVYARSIPDAKPGHYVALRVSDTGSGIAPDILDRIFDPFFTTKGSDKGTGLGLSTVLGIVKGHGGFVQAYSQLGKGTSFTVYLPAATPESREATPAPVADKAEEALGHGETVLFVDDEAAVREVGKTVLERLHYKALVATDGADGLAMVTDHKKDLSVVVTDLHMPHMDGLAFVRALRRTLPDIPVVLASGRIEESVWAELQALGVDHRLDKPFTQEQLARTLGKALEH